MSNSEIPDSKRHGKSARLGPNGKSSLRTAYRSPNSPRNSQTDRFIPDLGEGVCCRVLELHG